MKKKLSLVLALIMVFSITACGSKNSASSTAAGSKSETADQTVVNQGKTPQTATASSEEAELAAEAAELKGIGDVEVKNGILTVSVTLPADFVGEETTQEYLDANAGEVYASGVRNEDGSVTYKMTKAQHRQMLARITSGMDESLKKLIDDETYSIADIAYNQNCTVFDVTLDSDSLGFADAFAAMMFYMYGGMYGIFSGDRPDGIIVNFYDPQGNLVESGNSADAGEKAQ